MATLETMKGVSMAKVWNIAFVHFFKTTFDYSLEFGPQLDALNMEAVLGGAKQFFTGVFQPKLWMSLKKHCLAVQHWSEGIY